MNGQSDPRADRQTEHADDCPEDEQKDVSEDPLAELQAKADENWDRYLRAAAELENVRKRAARDVDPLSPDCHRYATLTARFAGLALVQFCHGAARPTAPQGR